MRRTTLILVGIAVLALVLAGCGTKVPGVPDTVAKVNGKAIPASEYLETVSRRSGQDVLRNMIEQQIILQWAEEEKVAPTEEQVNKQIDIFKRDGLYEDQVKLMGEAGIKYELKAMQARTNLAEKFIKVSDKELQQVYDSMKQRYVHGERKQVTLIINSDRAKVEKAAKELEQGKDFDEVSGKYSDQRFAMRGPIKIWVDETQQGLPPALTKAAKGLKVGDLSDVFSISAPSQPSQYVVMKAIAVQGKTNKSFKDVKDEIKSAALMQKSQMDPAFIEKLNDKMKEAKIEVDIPEFKSIVNGFKNPPEPSPMMMPQQGPPQ